MSHVPHSTSKRPIRKAPQSKPFKPSPDFPLSPHPGGYWFKKIKGQVYYFGKWAKRENGQLIMLPRNGECEAARENYIRRKDDIDRGVDGRVRAASSKGGETVGDICNGFLFAKVQQHESGKLSARQLNDYSVATEEIVKHFGANFQVKLINPLDFNNLRAKWAKKWGPSRLGTFVQMTRTVFKWAYDNDVIATPIKVGSGFKRPKPKVLKRHKRTSNKKLFTPEECRLMLYALEGKEIEVTKKGKPTKLTLPANHQLRTMILLALNCVSPVLSDSELG